MYLSGRLFVHSNSLLCWVLGRCTGMPSCLCRIFCGSTLSPLSYSLGFIVLQWPGISVLYARPHTLTDAPVSHTQSHPVFIFLVCLFLPWSKHLHLTVTWIFCWLVAQDGLRIYISLAILSSPKMVVCVKKKTQLHCACMKSAKL